MLSDSQGKKTQSSFALSPMLTSAAEKLEQRLNGALSNLI